MGSLSTSDDGNHVTSTSQSVGIIGGSWSGLGCYAEYVVAPAFFTCPLPAELPVADGCSFFVNPWTCLQICSYAKCVTPALTGDAT